MNRVSKLLALLLAFVLSMGVFTGAVAEGNGVIEYPIYVDMTLDAAIANFTNLTPEKQYAVLVALGDDTAKQDELAAQLTEEQLVALQEYIAVAESREVPVTVVFTDAGPFMPPVKVQTTRQVMKYAARGAAADASEPVKADGVITTKEVIPNGTNGYTLRLTSYVTGEKITTTVTKTNPVDIVLVLDQSRSMAYNFSGNETNTNTERRQYAMKNAVNNFIGAVADKFENESDHRMAIVTFGSNASTLQGWTFVNDDGEAELKRKIAGLDDTPTGATNVAAGMTQAESLMGTGYSYTGYTDAEGKEYNNVERQKVVIVFTDGVPTTNTDFDTTVATNAIKSAKSLKDAGATVYTVGIFNGAVVSQLHGAKWDYTAYSDITCNGNVGEYWGGSLVSSLIGNNDFDPVDIAAGNRFLNYLSTNFPDATSIGVTKGWYNPGNHSILGVPVSGEGYRIDTNFERGNTGYYMTASDSTSLNGIFTEISNNIQNSSVSYELDAETVVKDVIADSFTLPEGADASSITVYTQSYASNFTDRGDAKGAVATLSEDKRTISVSGFDYADNWCGEEKENGTSTPHGCRLVIEIPIEVREGFLGGNNVPTNGSESGVYDDGAVVENFDVPEVNVPLKVPALQPADYHIYLLGNAPEVSALYNSATFANDGSWQKAYVDITTSTGTLTDVSNTEDTVADITVTVTPNSNGDGALGTPVTAPTPLTGTAHVYVYKPVLTFADSQIDYASIAADDYYNATNYKGVAWMHGTTEADASMGTPPALGLSYTPPALNTWLDAQNKVIGVEDVPVTVAVTLGSTDVTSHVTFVRNECKYSGCDWEANYKPNNPAFVVHITNVFGTLTIKKEGLNRYTYTDGSDYESAIVTVTDVNGNTWNVVLCKENSYTAKLIDLPAGNYTVTEQTDWTWRYKNDASVATAIVNGGQNTTVTFTNVHNNQQWLGGDNFKTNVFGQDSEAVTE